MSKILTIAVGVLALTTIGAVVLTPFKDYASLVTERSIQCAEAGMVNSGVEIAEYRVFGLPMARAATWTCSQPTITSSTTK